MTRPNISYPVPVQASASIGMPSQGPPRDMSGGPRRPSGGRVAPAALDSIITKLLVTTKQLLQGLDQWSQGQISEEEVSDVYVRLGNGFEQCVSSFRQVGMDTSELDNIPQDLRVCLEQALAEDPSPQNLAVFYPEIRNIIYNLLNGLKIKQASYKRLIADRSAADTPPVPPVPSAARRQQPSGDSASSHLVARAPTPGSTSSTSPASQHAPLPSHPSSQALADRQSSRSGLPARPAPPDAFRPPRTRPVEPPAQPMRRSASPQPMDPRLSSETSLPPEPQIVRHQLRDDPPPRINLAPSAGPSRPPPRPDRASRDSFGDPRPVSRFSMDSEITNASPVQSLDTPPRPSSSTVADHAVAIVPRLSLPSMDLSDPPPPNPLPIPEVTPETRATLAALQRSDALERRASKRFSSYTFNKMLPGSEPNKKIGSPQRPARRGERPPPMPALPESFPKASPLVPPAEIRTNGDVSLSSSAGSTSSLDPPLPIFGDPDTSMRVLTTPEPPGEMGQQSTPRPGNASMSAPDFPTPNPTISVYLQIGRQVKKAMVDLPISLSQLRLLFMERFEYDPGLEDFPDVYIRDHKTGVQFELEDMDDLREGCILNLNIEPLDQVKQHFDTTIASVMQELKEMKSSIAQSRHSMIPMSQHLAVSPSSQTVKSLPPVPPIPQLPSPAVAAVNSSSIDVQAQYEGLQSLRRDLAVMRQVHVDFLSDTKESFARLRSQNTSMREVVKTKMGGSRALLDNSKSKLEAQCQDTIQAVEDISDVIDAAREDAYKRYISPSRAQMATIRADLQAATDLAEQFTKDVAMADPTWRATWAYELNRVMEEQKLLSYQSKLAQDLKNDIKDAKEMLDNVQDFVNQRAAARAAGQTPSKNFRPQSPDEGGGIPNLLLQIRTKESNPDQRLKAIEAQQKAREREMSMKTDEFSSELQGFVGGRKLRKTGGTEEAERARQRRQDQTLKRMLTGEGTGTLTPQMTGGSVRSPPPSGGPGSVAGTPPPPSSA